MVYAATATLTDSPMRRPIEGYPGPLRNQARRASAPQTLSIIFMEIIRLPIANEIRMKQLCWDTLLYGGVISSVLASRQAGNVANGAIFEKQPPPAVGVQRFGHQPWPTSPQCITEYRVQRRK